MKKALILSVMLNLILVVALVFIIKSNETTVYTFSGENDYFVIERGDIVKNREFENISYFGFKIKDDIPSNAYGYTMELYFIDGDEKIVITRSGSKYNPDLGISKTKADVQQQLETFERDAWGNVVRQLQKVSDKNIINNFYFEITFITHDGQEITQTLKLDVVKTE